MRQRCAALWVSGLGLGFLGTRSRATAAGHSPRTIMRSSSRRSTVRITPAPGQRTGASQASRPSRHLAIKIYRHTGLARSLFSGTTRRCRFFVYAQALHTASCSGASLPCTRRCGLCHRSGGTRRSARSLRSCATNSVSRASPSATAWKPASDSRTSSEKTLANPSCSLKLRLMSFFVWREVSA